jgi:hypothetical protein
MVETRADVKAAISRRLDEMSKEDLERVLQFVDAPTGLPRGMTGAELMQLAGTMTHEEAAEMTRIIEEEFEAVDQSAW